MSLQVIVCDEAKNELLARQIAKASKPWDHHDRKSFQCSYVDKVFSARNKNENYLNQMEASLAKWKSRSE